MSEKQCNLIFGGGMKEVIDLIYPIGQTIIRDHNPADDYPWQTWEQDCVDRFPVGAGNKYQIDQTGGEAQHTLTVDEMPSHTHFSNDGWSGIAPITSRDFVGNILTYSKNALIGYTNPYTDGRSGADTTLSSTGKNQPHNNMPPYQGVYFWTRTA